MILPFAKKLGEAFEHNFNWRGGGGKYLFQPIFKVQMPKDWLGVGESWSIQYWLTNYIIWMFIWLLDRNSLTEFQILPWAFLEGNLQQWNKTSLNYQKLYFTLNWVVINENEILDVRKHWNRKWLLCSLEFCVSLSWIIWCVTVNTVIYLFPLGPMQTKELLSDDNSGNRITSCEPKKHLLGNLDINVAYICWQFLILYISTP